MIKFDCDEWNVVNLIIVFGMLGMNYMISGLIILQICFKKWIVVEYVKKLSWTIDINILGRWTMYIVKQNDFELGCIPYGTTNCLLSSHTTNKRNVFLFAMLY